MAAAIEIAINNKVVGASPSLIHLLESAPTPFIPKTSDFFSFHPVEIARQLTLMEMKNFVQIKPTECVHQAWTKQDKEIRAPNIVKYIKQANSIPMIIAKVILSYPDTASRAKAITNFIVVAEVCKTKKIQILHFINSFFFLH